MNHQFVAAFAAVFFCVVACGQVFDSVDLTIRLRADSGVTSAAGQVSSWTDQKAPLAGFQNGSLPTQPKLELSGPGGAPYVHFGTDPGPDLNAGFLIEDRARSADALFSPAAATLFLVVRGHGESSPLSWSDGGGGAPQALYFQQQDASGSSLITFHHGDGAGTDIRTTANSFSDSWHVLTLQRDGSEGHIRVDGVPLLLEAGFDSFSSPVAGSLTPLYGIIGLGGQGGNPESGDSLDLAEVLHFKSALSGFEISQMEQSLGQTYNIAVVPEPSAWSLLAVSGLLVWGVGRRALK